MPNENPVISVIIPAYNAGSHLARCLDSVKRQTFTCWELIIADDGSTDKTGRIADDYSAADSRISVIHTEKRGVSSARNACLAKACGSYITFADSDDIMEPEYLEQLLMHAVQSDADITQCSFVFSDEEGNRTPDPFACDRILHGQDEITDAYFTGPAGDIRVSVWAKLFRREAFAGILFDPELSVYEDAYFTYLCCRKAGTVCLFSSPLYIYSQHGGSTMNSALAGSYSCYFTVFDRQLEDFRDDRPVTKRIAKRKAENALWLMRILVLKVSSGVLRDLRHKALSGSGAVLVSDAPFRLKFKLCVLRVMPHLYYSRLKRKAVSGNEKV